MNLIFKNESIHKLNVHNVYFFKFIFTYFVECYMKYLKCLGFFSFETKATAKKRKKENLIEAQKTGPEMVINVNAGTA